MEYVALVRDLVIILVGLIWLVVGIIVGIVAWLAWKFVRTLPGRAETVTTPVRELVGQARQTLGTAGEGAHTAKEAIAFVSEKAVFPTIGVVSASVAARRFVQVLVSGLGRGERDAIG